jgi:hypothetical protein
MTAITIVNNNTKTAMKATKTKDSFVPFGTDASVADTRNSRNDNADRKASDVRITRFSTKSTLTVSTVDSTINGMTYVFFVF